MKKTISLQELIAYNNPSKAKALVVKYGYRPARSYNDLIQKLFILTKEHREDALKDLVDIHPHKDLILHYAMPTPVTTEIKSNCDGDTMCPVCMAKAKEKYNNFEGTDSNTMPSTNNDWKAYVPMVALTTLSTLVVLALIKRIG